MNIKSVNDLYGGRQAEELESVILSPFAVSKGTSGTINMPSGVTLFDFESFNITMGIAASTIVYDAQEILKSTALNEPTVKLQHISQTLSTHFELEINFDYLNNRITWSGFINGVADIVFPLDLVGNKKKYATTNLSRTLQVNGGADITVNGRYEILASELPANFLDDSGNIKKNVDVIVEIFNNSGTGVAIYAEVGYYEKYNATGGTNFSDGVLCGVVGDKIVVEAGTSRLLRGSVVGLKNLFSATADISAAPCQVVATLSGEAYTIQTA